MRDCLCITTPIAFSSFTVYCLLFEVGEAVVETQISLTLKSDVRQVRAVVVARVLRVFSVRQFVDGRHAGWGGRLSQVRVEVVGQLRQTVVLQWKFKNNVITVLYFLVLHNHSRTKQSSLRCTLYVMESNEHVPGSYNYVYVRYICTDNLCTLEP